MYVQQKAHDILPIPDKYNTGCDVSAITTIVSAAGTYNGIVYGTTGGTRRSFDFSTYSLNNLLGDTILIENTSFPDGLQDINTSGIARTITFRNCFFNGRYQIAGGNNINYIYEDCEWTYCSPSYSTFYNCAGFRTEGAGDGMNPFKNVTAYSCYFYDLVHLTTATNVHCDGVQIFGYTGVNAENIHFINCVFRTPIFPIEGQATGTYANAPIMIQMESSNGIDISFENCYINGGGYSIYAWAKNVGTTLTDILLKDIKIGGAHQFGDLYHPEDLDPEVTMDNVSDTTKLIVGSVDKDINNHVILTVANDTLSAKNLIVYTNLGFQFHQIPACFNSADLMEAPITTYYSFDDYPFDLQIDCGEVDYVVAFDTTVSIDNQIRFVNYTETPVEFPDVSNEVKAHVNAFMNRRRQILMSNNTEPTYTPLQYIQGTGTQYIDFGRMITGSTGRIRAKFIVTASGIQWLFGARTTSSTKSFSAYVNGGASTGVISTAYNSNTVLSSALAGLKTGSTFIIDKDGLETKIYDGDGVLLETLTNSSVDFTTDYNVLLFAINTGGTITVDASACVEYQQYDGDTLLIDAIATLDGSSVPNMYDKVAKTFHYNAGTGTFLYA